jgi:uncharacterized protein YodC (DUF2158 family)
MVFSLAGCAMYSTTRAAGNAEMVDKTISPNIEVFNLPEDKRPAGPNPFKPGDAVRLRDGGGSNGTVVKVFGNEVLIAWDGVRGEPKWYHQDEVAAKKEAPAVAPNPFKVGDAVHLRNGSSANVGTVVGIFGDGVRIEWAAFPGEPEWYPQNRVVAAKKPAGPAPAVKDNQVQQSIFDQACRLVASMDDNQRRRFIAYIGETYK